MVKTNDRIPVFTMRYIYGLYSYLRPTFQVPEKHPERGFKRDWLYVTGSSAVAERPRDALCH